MLTQPVINEVGRASPQALQAVKLLAQYYGRKLDKVGSQQGLHPVSVQLSCPSAFHSASEPYLHSGPAGTNHVHSVGMAIGSVLLWQCNHPSGGRNYLCQRGELCRGTQGMSHRADSRDVRLQLLWHASADLNVVSQNANTYSFPVSVTTHLLVQDGTMCADIPQDSQG